MTQGQIVSTTKLGVEIKRIIKEYKPSSIIEFGTWKGLGSTKQVIDGIIEADYKPELFLSFETNSLFYKIAKNNLKQYEDIVKLIHGRIIGISELKTRLKDIEGELGEGQELEKILQYFGEDIENYEKCENVLQKIPTEIDLLILDGGEVSTYLEWQKLKDRANIVILDDSNLLKTKRVAAETLLDENFKLVKMSDERNGHYIFKRV